METIMKKQKSHRFCSVPHCKSTCSKEISLFLLPKSKDLAKKWSDILDIRKQSTKYIYVCSLHFDKNDFSLSMSAKKRRLKNGAIPSKNLPIAKTRSNGKNAPRLLENDDIKIKEEFDWERASFKKMVKDESNHGESLAECRACLQLCSNEEQYNLFQCWNPPWPGMENTLAEDLSKLACIQISETDLHSKIICESCFKHLQNACQFVEIVKKADEVLNLRLENNPPTLDTWPRPIQVDKNVPYNDVQIKDEILSDEEIQQNNGDDFSNVDVKIEADDWANQPVHINGIISLGQLNNEMAEINGCKTTIEQCVKNKLLTNEEPIINGVQHHNHDKAESFNVNLSTEARVKEEPASDAEDNNADEYNMIDISLECVLCTKSFLSFTGLKAHVIAQHSYKTVRRKDLEDKDDELNYVCKTCQIRFQTPTDLMVHEVCHNKCMCYGCNTNFDTFDELSRHRRYCQTNKKNEVGKVLKLEDVQRMANIAQRIIEVITKFTIFAQESEQGNIDECYQSLLAVITQKEDSICDDLSDDDDDEYNLSDLELPDDILLEYNKRFLSDSNLQKKSFIDQDTGRCNETFSSVDHSFKPITKLPYPIVEITRLESPILENLKSNYLCDSLSDMSSTYEEYEELDENEFILESELSGLPSKYTVDGIETNILENQMTENIDTNADLLVENTSINDNSMSNNNVELNSLDENVVCFEFDDSDDEINTDDVSICLEILSKSCDDTDTEINTLTGAYLEKEFDNTKEIFKHEIINIMDKSDSSEKQCKVRNTDPIPIDKEPSLSKTFSADIVISSDLTSFNNKTPTYALENKQIDDTFLPISPSLSKQEEIEATNLGKPYSIHTHFETLTSPIFSNILDKYKKNIDSVNDSISNTLKIMMNFENDSEVQTDELSTDIICDWQDDVIEHDVGTAKEASPCQMSSFESKIDGQTLKSLDLPKILGEKNNFLFIYKNVQQIGNGCNNNNCSFGCYNFFTAKQRLAMFNEFWTMDRNAQSKFFDDHVVQTKYNYGYMFKLSASSTAVRVCQHFIKDTFSLSMFTSRNELRNSSLSSDCSPRLGENCERALNSCKEQRKSRELSQIHKLKENEKSDITSKQPIPTNVRKKVGNHTFIKRRKFCDTSNLSKINKSQRSFINKTDNVRQKNYANSKHSSSNQCDLIGRETTCDISVHRHLSLNNYARKNVDECNKSRSAQKNKPINKKVLNVLSMKKNKCITGASNIKKPLRFNNVKAYISSSDKVSFSRSNPYVKLIDIGFYYPCYSLTDSSNESATKNIAVACHNNHSITHGRHAKCQRSIDQISDNDNSSQSILENKSEDRQRNSQNKFKFDYQLENRNQQINMNTNDESLLEDEMKINIEESEHDISKKLLVSNNLNTEISDKCCFSEDAGNMHDNGSANEQFSSENDKLEYGMPNISTQFVGTSQDINLKTQNDNSFTHPIHSQFNAEDNINNKHLPYLSPDVMQISCVDENFLSDTHVRDDLTLLDNMIIKNSNGSCCIDGKITTSSKSDGHLTNTSSKELLPSNEGSNSQDGITNNKHHIHSKSQNTNDSSTLLSTEYRQTLKDQINTPAMEIVHNEHQVEGVNNLPYTLKEDFQKSNYESNLIDIKNNVLVLNDTIQTAGTQDALSTLPNSDNSLMIQDEKIIDYLDHSLNGNTLIASEIAVAISDDIDVTNPTESPIIDAQIDFKHGLQQQSIATNEPFLAVVDTYNEDTDSSNTGSSPDLQFQTTTVKDNSITSVENIRTMENQTEVLNNIELPVSDSKLNLPRDAATINLNGDRRKKLNHFKLQRIIGKGYKFMFRYKVTRTILPGCYNCTYKCTRNIGIEQRRIIFENFWKMDIRAQTNYLNDNVFLINPILGLHDIKETHMKRNHIFFLSVYEHRFRVCKKFFLTTLSIIMTDLKHNSTHLKIMQRRLNPHVVLDDVAFHTDPASETVVEVNLPFLSNTVSLLSDEYIETPVSYPFRSNSGPSNTSIELSNDFSHPQYVNLNNDSFDAYQNSSSNPQSPIYAHLSIVDQNNANHSSTVEVTDKNTRVISYHENSYIDSSISSVLEINSLSNEKESFKSILKDWVESQEIVDRETFTVTEENVEATFVETDAFIEINNGNKNIEICDNSCINRIKTSNSEPYHFLCDNNSFAFSTQTHKESYTENLSKDSKPLCVFEDTENGLGILSKTLNKQQNLELAPIESLSKRQPVVGNSGAVDPPRKIDFVSISVSKLCENCPKHFQKENVPSSECTIKHFQENFEIISSSTAIPIVMDSINSRIEERSQDKSSLQEININQQASLINANEENSSDGKDIPNKNVIQDVAVAKILHLNQKNDTSAIKSDNHCVPNSSLNIHGTIDDKKKYTGVFANDSRGLCSLNSVNENISSSECNLNHFQVNVETISSSTVIPILLDTINLRSDENALDKSSAQEINIDSSITVNEGNSSDANGCQWTPGTNLIQEDNFVKILNQQQDKSAIKSNINFIPSYSLNLDNKNRSNESFSSNKNVSRESYRGMTPNQENNYLVSSIPAHNNSLCDFNLEHNQNSPNKNNSYCSSIDADKCYNNPVYFENNQTNEKQLIEENRQEYDYAQMYNAYEATNIERYFNAKDTYESESSRSTIELSQSSLDFYNSYDSQPDVVNVVEFDVTNSFKTILNDWAS